MSKFSVFLINDNACIAFVKTAAMEGNRDSDPPRFVYVSRLRTRGNLTDPEAEVAAWKRRLPPLLRAARENRPDEIKRLIEEGMSVNVKDGCELTALHMAALLGNPGTQFNAHCTRSGRRFDLSSQKKFHWDMKL